MVGPLSESKLKQMTQKYWSSPTSDYLWYIRDLLPLELRYAQNNKAEGGQERLRSPGKVHYNGPRNLDTKRAANKVGQEP